VESSGTELPQENGIDASQYYMDETEQLMRAFGISAIEQLPVVSTAVAISTVDRTDYSRLTANVGNIAANNVNHSQSAKQPWWKFW
jgi:hypothetical protein